MTIVRSGPVSGQGIDKIFGFESIVEEQVANTTLAAGTNNLAGTAVPAGKIWKITQASIYYSGTITSVEIQLYPVGLATGVILLDVKSPVSAFWYPWSGEIYLQAEDYMNMRITGATLNDDAYLRYAGVQMNAP